MCDFSARTLSPFHSQEVENILRGIEDVVARRARTPLAASRRTHRLAPRPADAQLRRSARPGLASLKILRPPFPPSPAQEASSDDEGHFQKKEERRVKKYRARIASVRCGGADGAGQAAEMTRGSAGGAVGWEALAGMEARHHTIPAVPPSSLGPPFPAPRGPVQLAERASGDVA